MDAGESSSSSSSKTQRGRRGPSPDPAARLTDDLLVEILSRVPHRSLCRFRCVSRHWRALIDHPDHRRTLPQGLVGFFYPRPSAGVGAPVPTGYCFANVPGTSRPFIDASFPFLPDREREHLELLETCNGLLLCRSFRYPDPALYDYLVLNPATEEWVSVPGPQCWSYNVEVETARLGFDPADSSHFHVFEFQSDENEDNMVKIYSSKTRVWIHKQCGWSFDIGPRQDCKSLFLKGVLYVIVGGDAIGSVDAEGQTWRIIDFPRSKDSPMYYTGHGFIDLSQGQLHFANTYGNFYDIKLAIWVLDVEKDGEEWTLKHTVHNDHLVGQMHYPFGLQLGFVAIHPERNIVFFVSSVNLMDRRLMSYDMDSGEVCLISKLGHCEEHFIPYIHMFSKALADGNQ